MSAFTAVVEREVVEKRLALLSALVAGAVPFVVPLVPGTGGPPADVRGVAAFLLTLAFGGGCAVLLGATVFVRDLAGGRLGFYFSRPVSGLALWAGKVLAAWAVSAGAAILVALPAHLTGSRLVSATSLTASTAGIFTVLALAPLFLVALAHALATVAFLRSPWLVIDTALFPLAVVGWFTAWRRSEAFTYPRTGEPRLLAPLAILLAILLLASLAQIAAGRTDIRRSRGAFSATLWTLSILCVLAFWAWTLWVTTGRPSDGASRSLTAAPRGSWALVESEGRGGSPALFLRNASSGAYRRLTPPAVLAFSEDGRTAAWIDMRPGLKSPSFQLVTASLGEHLVERERADIPVSWTESLALSPSGSSLAILEGGTLSVLELANGRTLAAVKRPTAAPLALSFAGEDRLRVAARRAHPAHLDGRAPSYELDVTTRRLDETSGK